MITISRDPRSAWIACSFWSMENLCQSQESSLNPKIYLIESYSRTFAVIEIQYQSRNNKPDENFFIQRKNNLLARIKLHMFFARQTMTKFSVNSLNAVVIVKFSFLGFLNSNDHLPCK